MCAPLKTAEDAADASTQGGGGKERVGELFLSRALNGGERKS